MTLPETLRLARHTPVLAPHPDVRVLGAHPATAVVVEDLPPPLADLIDGLDAPCRTADLVVEAVARQVPAGVTAALLEQLVHSGVVRDAARVAAAARAREDASVIVAGAGPLTVGVVTGLLAAGVGAVYTATHGTVGPDELGTGLTRTDVGRARTDAVRDAAARLGCATGPPPARLVADLAVLADQPSRADVLEALHSDDIAYLPAILCDGRGLVGPLVLPRRSPCPGCVDRHRADGDGLWPALWSAPPVAGRGRPHGHADVACAVATAALTTAQAIAALGGVDGAGPPPALGATLDLYPAAGTCERHVWAAHPDCPCGAAAGRVTIMG